MPDEEKKDISIRFSRFLTGIHHSGSEALDGIYAGNSSLINVLNWTGRRERGGRNLSVFQKRLKIKIDRNVMISFQV